MSQKRLGRDKTRGLSWDLFTDADSKLSSQNITLALLMDIRDELQTLNQRLRGLTDINTKLRTISAKIPPRRKRRA